MRLLLRLLFLSAVDRIYSRRSRWRRRAKKVTKRHPPRRRLHAMEPAMAPRLDLLYRFEVTLFLLYLHEVFSISYVVGKYYLRRSTDMTVYLLLLLR